MRTLDLSTLILLAVAGCNSTDTKLNGGQGNLVTAGRAGAAAGAAGGSAAGAVGSAGLAGAAGAGGTGAAAGVAGAAGDGGGAGSAGSAGGDAGAAGQPAGGSAGGAGTAGQPAGGAAGAAGGSGQIGGTGGAGEAGAAGSSGGAAGTSGAGGTPGVCPSGRGSPMTKITVTSTGRTFCIDNHEATQGEYSQFLKDLSAWDPPGQYPTCVGTSRMPAERVIDDQHPFDAGCPPGVFLPETTPNQPVSCVSYCGAYAFCAWAGKRLCGGIDGGPIAPTAEQFDKTLPNAPAVHEWGYVCSSRGAQPSGAAVTSECVVAKSGWKAPSYDAAAPTSCVPSESEFAAVVNMTGGLSEWLGGTYATKDGYDFMAVAASYAFPGLPECGDVALTSVGAIDGSRGIRCCAD